VDQSDRPPSSRLVVTRSVDIGLLIDLGRQERSDIKLLKRSDGPLALQIQAAVEEQRDQLGIGSVEVVPVVFLYRAREGDDRAAEPPERGEAGE
jgi:hypothetical protein